MSEHNKFTEFVTFKLAELLNNAIYANDGFSYAAEDLECTNDNFTGSIKHKRGEFFDSEGDYVHGKFYRAPTYAEVIDYLINKFGIHIQFTPWFTYALNGHTAYTYKVFKIDEENSKMKLLFEMDNELASFELCVEEIVEKVIKNKENTAD